MIRRGDVPPEVWSKLTGGPVPAPKGKVRQPAMVAPAFCEPGTWWVAVQTTVEVNARSWRERNARTHAARRAVSRALGPHLRALAPFAEHYAAGGAVRVTLTRLGGRRCDRGNLASAMKGCEDMLALLLGADDGDPRWRVEFEQEPGGSVGVRIELEVMP